ncbi:hypothetical protein M0805_003807 [Coniferiporia weirii]|nr:hypothetical protein M0805_003807 [Coniferiporia weirii]
MKSLTKVIYKPNSQSTEEYMMYVNPVEYKKWKDGVVDSFKVFVSSTGKQGYLGEASNLQLETIFGSKNDFDVAEILLRGGTSQAGDRLDDDRLVKNLSHGDYRMDVRGSGAQTTGA